MDKICAEICIWSSRLIKIQEVERMAQIIYELPQEREKVVEIVKCIPSTSTWIDGYLIAPRDLYQRCQIAENTQLLISKPPYQPNELTIIGADNVPYEDEHRDREKKEVYTNINDIVIKQKLFSSIKFQEAAYKTGKCLPELTMDAVKELIQHFIIKGYSGWITATDLYDNPDRFAIKHADRTIELMWGIDPHSPKRENLDIIVNFEKLGINRLYKR